MDTFGDIRTDIACGVLTPDEVTTADLRELVDELDSELESKVEELDDIRERIQRIEDGDRESDFDDMLDEQGEIRIAGVSFRPAYILHELDECAYNEAYNNYFDEELSELESSADDEQDRWKEQAALRWEVANELILRGVFPLPPPVPDSLDRWVQSHSLGA